MHTVRLKKLLLTTAAMLAAAMPATANAQSTAGINDAVCTQMPEVPCYAWTLEEFAVTTNDGVALRGHVYKPRRPGPYATILELSPYFGGRFFATEADYGEYDPYKSYLREGFAVALVNPRGSGDSDGCMDFGGRRDVADAKAVVEALAAREWSNGSVGMIGHSYPAWTAYMAMTAAPKGLKAIVPMSGTIDLWSLASRRGAPFIGYTGMFNGLFMTAFTAGQDADAVRHAACPEMLDHHQEFAELGRSAAVNDFWRERDLREGLRDSEVAVMVANGLLQRGEGHILQVEGLWDLLRPDRTRMILGQWAHEQPDNYWGDPDNGVNDWLNDVVGWFDHYLRGGEMKLATGIVHYQDDGAEGGDWHQSDRWPPLASTTTVRLSGGGRLVPSSAAVEPGDASFQSAETDPGHGAEEPRLIGESAGPAAAAVCGPHHVVYTSPPLAGDALIAGNIDLEVTITSTLPGGNFSVYVWKTAGDGSCPDIGDALSDAETHDVEATVFGRAMMDLRHWRKAGRPEGFPVGEATRVRMRSQPFASELRSGERIVVAIGGGNPEIVPDPLHPRITVHSGRFDLPVVQGALRFEK